MAEIISVSMDKDTAEGLDRLVKEKGYGSRSEFVRIALNSFILEKKQLGKKRGHANAVIVVNYLSEHGNDIGAIRHRYAGIIQFQTHHHVNDLCFEVFNVSGGAAQVLGFYEALERCKKTKNCKIVIF